jgi:murein L,D-transpeptidase YcbB/YkuD
MVRRNGWIVQLPGPGNALGLVKFDLVNDYAIYLHDTSARSLFERNERHLSHGCVRVNDALGFARMIARQQGIMDEWQEARASGEETFLRLPDRIPVRLLYHPTFLDPAGKVRFGRDVYGWNGTIAERLGFEQGDPARQFFSAEIEDLGP